ncbi:MAG TPA: hypothetical protein VOA41_03590 [Candidatus Dormibacteraeota bacterium]|nr:hypothetical protein [Candidatus Dormibacteraeota bacterium]
MIREIFVNREPIDGLCGLPREGRFRHIAALAGKLCSAMIERCQTRDVFQICKLAGVKLDYRRWPLVTIGECERRPPTIRVNLAALDYIEGTQIAITRKSFEQIIIAHELGHLLGTGSDALANEAPRSGLKTAVTEPEALAFEEYFAGSFAAALGDLSCGEHENVRMAAYLCRVKSAQDTSSLSEESIQENSRGYA